MMMMVLLPTGCRSTLSLLAALRAALATRETTRRSQISASSRLRGRLLLGRGRLRHRQRHLFEDEILGAAPAELHFLDIHLSPATRLGILRVLVDLNRGR